MVKDKLDKIRDKVEKVLYNAAVVMAKEPYNLSYAQIKDNLVISIEETIDLLDFQSPEISPNGK
tara:strand:+ start:245 stop:436 length:192 start_codon:yes stop_codon:yes gene_type:complete